MDDRSWMERTFGESWETSATGFGGMVLGILCIILANSLEIPALETIGQAVTTIALGVLGYLARSNAASEKKAGQLDQRITSTQHDVTEVKAEAKEEARKVAVDTVKEAKV